MQFNAKIDFGMNLVLFLMRRTKDCRPKAQSRHINTKQGPEGRGCTP